MITLGNCTGCPLDFSSENCIQTFVLPSFSDIPPYDGTSDVPPNITLIPLGNFTGNSIYEILYCEGSLFQQASLAEFDRWCSEGFFAGPISGEDNTYPIGGWQFLYGADVDNFKGAWAAGAYDAGAVVVLLASGSGGIFRATTDTSNPTTSSDWENITVPLDNYASQSDVFSANRCIKKILPCNTKLAIVKVSGYFLTGGTSDPHNAPQFVDQFPNPSFQIIQNPLSTSQFKIKDAGFQSVGPNQWQVGFVLQNLSNIAFPITARLLNTGGITNAAGLNYTCGNDTFDGVLTNLGFQPTGDNSVNTTLPPSTFKTVNGYGISDDCHNPQDANTVENPYKNVNFQFTTATMTPTATVEFSVCGFVIGTIDYLFGWSMKINTITNQAVSFTIGTGKALRPVGGDNLVVAITMTGGTITSNANQNLVGGNFDVNTAPATYIATQNDVIFHVTLTDTTNSFTQTFDFPYTIQLQPALSAAYNNSISQIGCGEAHFPAPNPLLVHLNIKNSGNITAVGYVNQIKIVSGNGGLNGNVNLDCNPSSYAAQSISINQSTVNIAGGQTVTLSFFLRSNSATPSVFTIEVDLSTGSETFPPYQFNLTA